MAIAPVLERKVNTTVSHSGENTRNGYVPATEDEIHNSRIKDNWQKLINPEAKIDDIFGRNTQVEQNVSMPAYAPTSTAHTDYAPVNAPAAQPRSEQLYRVENARATADIFRADSYINAVQRPVVSTDVAPKASVYDEEESEDLRPTSTTIQYKTLGNEEKQIKAEKTEGALSKKEKIIIASFVGIVVMLFALIIINAAVISGLNAEVGSLQSVLEATQSAFETVNAQVAEAASPENVIGFANANGMIFLGGN